MPATLYTATGRTNLKSGTVGIGDLDEFMRWNMHRKQGGNAGDYDPAEFKRRVPWLYACVELVADKVADLPFQILDEGKQVVDDTDEWQGVLPFTENIRDFLWMATISLMMRGKAYFLPESNRLAMTKGTLSSIKYFNADTIIPDIDAKVGLRGFVRKLPNEPPVPFPIYEESGKGIIYFWLLDDNVELGEPKSYPAQAALDAAGVLFNLDEFFRMHVQRGLVKAFIASAKGMNDKDQRDEMSKTLSNMLTGIKNAFQVRVFNADTVTITPVGEGFKELENVNITQAKREDISVALRVPMTYLWSSQARGLGGGGVATEDTFRLYEDRVVPMFNFIAAGLNRQILNDLGYTMKVKKESIAVYQEDKGAQATSVSTMTAAMADPIFEIAAEVTGVKLTEAQLKTLHDIWDNKQKMAEILAAQPKQNSFGQGNQGGQRGGYGGSENPQEPSAPTSSKTVFVVGDPLTDHLDKWKRKALKSLANGKSAAVEFDSDVIAPDMHAAIRDALGSAGDEDDVRGVFENVKSNPNHEPVQTDSAHLAAQFSAAMDEFQAAMKTNA